jgi:hypothetical protein
MAKLVNYAVWKVSTVSAVTFLSTRRNSEYNGIVAFATSIIKAEEKYNLYFK